jgi:hypothetical protein
MTPVDAKRLLPRPDDAARLGYSSVDLARIAMAEAGPLTRDHLDPAEVGARVSHARARIEGRRLWWRAAGRIAVAVLASLIVLAIAQASVKAARAAHVEVEK